MGNWGGGSYDPPDPPLATGLDRMRNSSIYTLTVNKNASLIFFVKFVPMMNKNNFMSTGVHTVSIVNGLTTEVIAFHASVVLLSELT